MGRLRYHAVGHIYDVASLEPVLYRRSRVRLVELLGPATGETVVDVGCGTGANFAPVLAAVGPSGYVVGVDASASTLAHARRRVGAEGWDNVTLLLGDAAHLLGVLARAGIDRDEVHALLATFVLSLLSDDEPVWDAIDVLAMRHPVRVGIADIGEPVSAPPPLRPLYRLLAAAGGADASRRPRCRRYRGGGPWRSRPPERRHLP